MKYLKYLIISLILLLPVGVGAMDADATLNCDKSLLSVNESTSCRVELDITSGGVKSFNSNINVSSNLEITGITVASDWINNSGNNNISVQTDTAKNGDVLVAIFQVKAVSVVPESTENISLTNISLTDETNVSSNLNDISKNIRIPSNNASLTNLNITGGTLSPSFSPDILEYTVNGIDSDKITINATANANASISGTGTKSLNYGTNTFEVLVKAEAGNTKTYKIVVNREDNRSNDSSLKSISVNDELLDLNYNNKSYRIELPSTSQNLKIAVETNNGKAIVKYSANNVSLKLDETYTIFIYVTAENGSMTTYSVTATRKDDRSSNNNLQSLTVNNEKISLTSLQSYTLTVNNNVTSASIKAIAQDTTAKVEIRGNNTLKVGSNSFTITVTAENEAIKTYKLTIIRKNESGDITNLSNNTYLKILQISDYKLEFNKDTFEYNLEVESNVTKLNIKYETEDTKAEATIDGNNDFKEGLNKINILVTAENGETATYVINVTKLPKNYEVENDEKKIIAALNNKTDYEQVIVKVTSSDDLIITKDIVAALIKSQKTITYSVMKDSLIKYSFILNGSLFNDYDDEINYSVLFNNNEDDNLNTIIGNRKNIVLDFDHNGVLPTGTVFRLYVGDTFENGNNLYLYYYNTLGKLELKQESLVVTDGYVNIPLEHCSMYVLLNTNLDESPSDKPAPDNTNSSNINMLYVYIAGGVLLLVVVIVIVVIVVKKKSKKQKLESNNSNNDVANANNNGLITPINEAPIPNLEATGVIDIIDLDDSKESPIPANNNMSISGEYFFGISVMDIDDYLEKCPLAGLKNENINDGIVIVSIEKNSPLLKVGIVQGDVLTGFNGNKIVSKENFKILTNNVNHGSKCLINYHQNGQEKQVEVII